MTPASDAVREAALQTVRRTESGNILLVIVHAGTGTWEVVTRRPKAGSNPERWDAYLLANRDPSRTANGQAIDAVVEPYADLITASGMRFRVDLAKMRTLIETGRETHGKEPSMTTTTENEQEAAPSVIFGKPGDRLTVNDIERDYGLSAGGLRNGRRAYAAFGEPVAKKGRSMVWRRDAVEAGIRRGEFRSVIATKGRQTIAAEKARKRFYALKNEGPIEAAPVVETPKPDAFDAGPGGQSTQYDPAAVADENPFVDATEDPVPVASVERTTVEVPAVRDIRPAGDGDGGLVVTVWSDDGHPMTLHGVRVVVTDATVLA